MSIHYDVLPDDLETAPVGMVMVDHKTFSLLLSFTNDTSYVVESGTRKVRMYFDSSCNAYSAKTQERIAGLHLGYATGIWGYSYPYDNPNQTEVSTDIYKTECALAKKLITEGIV